jgi:hypothetical protein
MPKTLSPPAPETPTLPELRRPYKPACPSDLKVPIPVASPPPPPPNALIVFEVPAAAPAPPRPGFALQMAGESNVVVPP